MYIRRSAAVKYFGFAFLGSILYSEFFVYILQPIYWNRLRCPQNDLSCTKILFVADPQIQGELAFEAPWSYIINWDSDRYLRSTFSVAVKHFRPDVVVYLGDLTDEGSIATMPQFHGYVKRLFDIFDVDYPLVQIWTPGDNDIGGENEPVYKNKVEEFDKVFYQLPVITYRNVTFYKVNGITRTFPRREEDAMSKKLGIVVSHYPITSNSLFGRQVHKEIRPNIYFCAHGHDSKYVTQNEDFTNRVLHRLQSGDAALRVNFSNASLHEVHVPTCSYRMGTDQMGYGAAVLENYDSVMRYTVFWSPKSADNQLLLKPNEERGIMETALDTSTNHDSEPKKLNTDQVRVELTH